MLKGPFREHRDFRLNVDNMADDSRRYALEETIKGVRDLVDYGFEMTTDPMNRSWPDRLDDEPHPLLRKTLAMYESFVYDWDAAGGSISVPVSYVTTHQYGTNTHPVRQMFPERGDVPHAWNATLEGILTEMQETFLSRKADNGS